MTYVCNLKVVNSALCSFLIHFDLSVRVTFGLSVFQSMNFLESITVKDFLPIYYRKGYWNHEGVSIKIFSLFALK